MAEIGLGYGSEFQLMRFLGHHRNELEKLIHEATGTNGQIEWFDYPYDDNRISGDKEYIGIECFKNLDNNKDIEKSWKEYWPQSGNSMNWDGIFKIDDTWFFVEAKAHENEAKQKCGATSEKSRTQIEKTFEDTQKWLGKKEKKMD